MTEEQITQFQELQSEKATLEQEMSNIEAFLNRSADNEDNARAINKGKVFVKFAGTACKLPEGIFIGAMNSRKAEINKRLTDIEAELIAL